MKKESTAHKTYKVKKVIKETPRSFSIILGGKIKFNPGQFVMLWLPKKGERPFAISYHGKDYFGITIEKKGKFTENISKIKKGTKIGIRGAYGNGFEPKDNSIVVVGGLGMAPALSLIKKIKNSIIIQGARSKEFLLYLKNKELIKSIKKNKNKIVYCTDDGSFGMHSFTTEVLKTMLNKRIKNAYTCGPEIMMKKVFEICERKKVNCYASLERFMKCGIGLCASCCINGKLVCKDGPVFDSKQIKKLDELGKFARLKSGKKVPIKEYYKWRK